MLMYPQNYGPYPYQMPKMYTKRTTPQSERDYLRVQQRVMLNGHKIYIVSNFIDRYFGTHVTIAILTSLAKIIMSKHKIKLDRLARRNRQALLCWYAENWDIICPVLKQKDFIDKVKLINEENMKIQKEKKEEEQTEQKIEEIVDPSDLVSLLNSH